MNMLDNLYWRLYGAVTRKLAEEDGINTIELVVILVALVGVALIFKDKLVALFTDFWSKISTGWSSPTAP